MQPVRFQGERAWEALIHHESLDSDEAEDFRQFCVENDCPEPENAAMAPLKNMLVDWRHWQGARR